MYLEGCITKLETLTHNLLCLSLPVSSRFKMEQNVFLVLFYCCCYTHSNLLPMVSNVCCMGHQHLGHHKLFRKSLIYLQHYINSQNTCSQAASNTQFVRSVCTHRNWACSVLHQAPMYLAQIFFNTTTDTEV